MAGQECTSNSQKLLRHDALTLSDLASFKKQESKWSSVRPLVPVNSSDYSPYIASLSTWSSSRGLSSGCSTKPYLGTGFVLICFQHLSIPYVATLRCLERDNRNTRGTSLKILSY